MYKFISKAGLALLFSYSSVAGLNYSYATDLNDETGLAHTYFQLFPNYFPSPQQPDRPTRSLNERTKIHSRLKLHPGLPAESNFRVVTERTEEGLNRQIVKEKDGNEFLYAMSCRNETLAQLEQKQQRLNLIRTQQRSVWALEQALSRITSPNFSVDQRARLSIDIIRRKTAELTETLRVLEEGVPRTVTVIEDTDELSFFGMAVFGYKLPLPCIQISNTRFIGCPNTPIQYEGRRHDRRRIEEVRGELGMMNVANPTALQEWQIARRFSPNANSLAGVVNNQVAELNRQIAVKEQEKRGIYLWHERSFERRNEIDIAVRALRHRVQVLEIIVDVYNATVLGQRATIEQARSSIAAVQASLAQNQSTYDRALRECSESIRLIPLPVGAIVGAKARRVVTEASSDADENHSEDNKRYFVRNEVSFFHPYKSDIPVALTEVELVYMPPWAVPVEDMNRIGTEFTAENFRNVTDRRFEMLFEIFTPQVNVSNLGGAAVGNSRVRLYMESRVLNQNNEFPEQPVNPIEKHAFVIDNYDKFVRSVGAWGALVKPPTLESTLVSQTVTNTMVRNLVSGRDFVDESLISPTMNSKVRELRRGERIDATLNAFEIPKWREIIAHEKNAHVKLMVEFGLMRRQNRSVSMCFQYVKDAMLLANLVDYRLDEEHARQAYDVLMQEKWQVDAINHPPISFSVARNDQSATVSERLVADYAPIAEQNKFRDIMNEEGAMLKRYCRRVYESIGVDVNSPMVQAVCDGRAHLSRAQIDQAVGLAREVARRKGAEKHPLQDWFANPRIECLAPYGSILIYRPLDGSRSGHIEIKTEEMGTCGFVSDHFHKKPITQRLPGLRSLMGILILKTN
jgi:hypothetical protein